MVDAARAADPGRGVDVGAGPAVGDLRDHPRHQRDPVVVQRVRDPVEGHGEEPGVGEDDLGRAVGRRVAGLDRLARPASAARGSAAGCAWNAWASSSGVAGSRSRIGSRTGTSARQRASSSAWTPAGVRGASRPDGNSRSMMLSANAATRSRSGSRPNSARPRPRRCGRRGRRGRRGGRRGLGRWAGDAAVMEGTGCGMAADAGPRWRPRCGRAAGVGPGRGRRLRRARRAAREDRRRQRRRGHAQEGRWDAMAQRCRVSTARVTGARLRPRRGSRRGCLREARDLDGPGRRPRSRSACRAASARSCRSTRPASGRSRSPSRGRSSARSRGTTGTGAARSSRPTASAVSWVTGRRVERGRQLVVGRGGRRAQHEDDGEPDDQQRRPDRGEQREAHHGRPGRPCSGTTAVRVAAKSVPRWGKVTDPYGVNAARRAYRARDPRLPCASGRAAPPRTAG